MSEVEVNIRSIASGGAGVGAVYSQNDELDNLVGIAAFVPYTIPGEAVNARVMLKKKNHIETELVSINSAAKSRVAPQCKHFMKCGGCELQHISTLGQIASKYEMISSAMKAARLDPSPLAPIAVSKPYFYRRRIALHINSSGTIGFYRPRSRSIVSLEHCPISDEKINALLGKTKELAKELKGKISTLLLEADDKGVIAVLKSPYSLSPQEIRLCMSAAKQHFSAAQLFVSEERIAQYGREYLELAAFPGSTLTLRFPPGGFSQVNWAINQSLIKRAVQALENTTATVYDLYAGAGNFALPLAKHGMKVVAVECNSDLVRLGNENAQIHGLELSENLS